MQKIQITSESTVDEIIGAVVGACIRAHADGAATFVTLCAGLFREDRLTPLEVQLVAVRLGLAAFEEVPVPPDRLTLLHQAIEALIDLYHQGGAADNRVERLRKKEELEETIMGYGFVHPIERAYQPLAIVKEHREILPTPPA